MRNRQKCFVVTGGMLFGACLAIGLLGASVTWAAEPSSLKLMVTDCYTGHEIDNALVEVVVWRKGQGEIDSASDYTVEGYVEFYFSDLEDGDKAQVTVTPSGRNPDGSHTYYWEIVQEPGGWDLFSGLDDICEDRWWDENEEIFECRYHDPERP